ncbi:MAG: dihydropteroate synthase [Betaproteobacteria bacterium]
MTSPRVWQCSRFSVALSVPKVMGIVNVTPDSFSDGGEHADAAAAMRHCEQLLKDGAEILDLGAESSRPGAAPLPARQEMERLLPLVRDAVKLGVPISVDTYKAEVMQAVLDLGADIVNDIWALRQPGALHAIAAHPNCGVCLMHMHRDPQTMQIEPMGAEDAVAQVVAFLRGRALALATAGVQHNRVLLDPGIGFGKTPAQNIRLLACQRDLLALGYPLLVGWSRKGSLGAITGLAVGHRQGASVAAALLAVQRGASVVRVHDVQATVAALKILQAVDAAGAHA